MIIPMAMVASTGKARTRLVCVDSTLKRKMRMSLNGLTTTTDWPAVVTVAAAAAAAAAAADA